MCGRFVMISPIPVIAKRFNVEAVCLADIKPSYNISPMQEIVIINKMDTKQLVPCRWGFLPVWVKDPSMGNKMINARAETIAEKPAFRHAFKGQRCLIAADGFYEWENRQGKKYPVYISLKSREPFGLAGLYNFWKSSQEDTICTAVIITTETNELIKPIHDRMPVIIPKEKEDFWIDPANKNEEGLLRVLKPYPTEEMELYPVSPRINSGGYNSPANIEPVEG
jgi:putative SOS response-associated peptidase YedK